ncbi:MAG: hypothetical protein ACR2LS_03215 [Thermomicrobiales bacterium]
MQAIASDHAQDEDASIEAAFTAICDRLSQLYRVSPDIARSQFSATIKRRIRDGPNHAAGILLHQLDCDRPVLW